MNIYDCAAQGNNREPSATENERKIHIPVELCEGSVSVYAFRVYAHLANTAKQHPKTSESITSHLRIHKATAKKALEELISLNLVEAFTYSDEIAVEWIKSKKPQSFAIASLECQWCRGTSVTLHDHHYPVRRSQGGIDTVKICPSCHAEFHFLTEAKFYQVKGGDRS